MGILSQVRHCKPFSQSGDGLPYKPVSAGCEQCNLKHGQQFYAKHHCGERSECPVLKGYHSISRVLFTCCTNRGMPVRVTPLDDLFRLGEYS